jgi:hypothetical protein
MRFRSVAKEKYEFLICDFEAQKHTLKDAAASAKSKGYL